jgi:hypothetical protein
MKHFLQKIKLIAVEFGMPEIQSLAMLPGQQLKLAEQVEEIKSYPLEGKYEQRPPMLVDQSPDKSAKKRTADKSIEKLEATVLQYKSDGSGKEAHNANRKRDRKKLSKLKENTLAGFFSCNSQDGYNDLALSQFNGTSNGKNVLQPKEIAVKVPSQS